MLQIANDLLPQSLLSYVAFRVAYRKTAETLSTQGSDWSLDDFEIPLAYLGEVPFLRETALPVQLELLSATWDRHLFHETIRATLLDESVIFAAFEFTARLCEFDPPAISECLRGGPLEITLPVDDALAAELRAQYLRLTNEGDFLLISQLLDLPPDEASEWKIRLGCNTAELATLFDVLARWRVNPELLGNLTGLVSVREVQWLARLLRVEVPA